MSSLKPPPYLSPSSISTFQQCPLKFKFSKIDGLKEDPTEATLMGNFVHDVLEDLYSMQPEDRTLEAARELAKLHWQEKWGEEISNWVRPDGLSNLRWNAWWCIENLWKLENPVEVNPEGVETKVSTEIRGVPIMGYIDRWSRGPDGIVITDYKTGKTPRPKYQDQKYQQLMIYAVAVQNLGFGQVSDIELLFLKGGDRLAKSVTKDDVEFVESSVVRVYSEVIACCDIGVFEPRPSILCDWCSFKPICPYWKK